MTLLKDNNYKEINVALLSLEADIKNKITNVDTSVIDRQLAEINSRIDKINAGGSSSAAINYIRTEIEDINSKLNVNSAKIENIEQKLTEIFTAENKVTDFNTTTDSGIYYWVNDAANKPGTDNGVLLVNKYDSGSNSIWINQIAYGTDNKIYFRQNINSGNWTEWKAVAFDGEITAKKVANALTVNGKTYDGSSVVDAGVQTVANGGTGATDAAGGFNTLADGVRDSSPPEDDNKMLFKPSGTWYKTTCLDFWNYIKGKISSVLGLTKDNYGGKSAKSSFLDEYVGAGGTRPTSINFVPKNASEYGGMRKDVVTSSMTDSGYPGQDGHLLTMFWDNSSRHDSQFFVSNEKQPTTVKVRVKANEADYGPWVDLITSQNIGSQTVANATRLKTFAYWTNPYEYDPTNGIRVNVYRITMASYFNSILVQIYDDINYARCRRYVLGLWHANGYGYNVSVTDLGGTKDDGLHVWLGNDGNVYLQADVFWGSRISFSRLDDITDVTITKIGDARYGSNTDINGNVLFTPLTDSIMDCGALRTDENLSSVSRVPQYLKTDVMRASSKMVIPIGAPSSPEDGCIWIER